MHIRCEGPVWVVFVTLSCCSMPVPCSIVVQGIWLLRDGPYCTIESWFPVVPYMPLSIQRHDYHLIWIDKQLLLTNHYWTVTIISIIINFSDFSEQFSQHQTRQHRWEESMWTSSHIWIPFSFSWLHGKQSMIMLWLFSLVPFHLPVVRLSSLLFSRFCCCFKRGSIKCLLHLKAFALCFTALYMCGIMWWIVALDLQVW